VLLWSAPAGAAGYQAVADGAFEGIQIETSDLVRYETFFREVLQAAEVQRRDHPGLDNLRGYCYRDVLVVVRQDLKTARPTGWVQINFTVPDAAAVQRELEDRIAKSSLAKMDESGKSAIVRLRLKPDVRRGDCKATRLEVGGPEGFMVGFDQIKTETCEAGSDRR
jgi:hypothetical protein